MNSGSSEMCDCPRFGDLELTREAIGSRARATPRLERRLDCVATHPRGEHALLRCPECGQLWQSSGAWNWGDVRYAFKVPAIAAGEWLELPFVQPDELLIFAACTERVRSALQAAPDGERCQANGCESPRVNHSLHCRRHHMQSLQSIGQLPKDPDGRWFEPYEWRTA